MEARFAKSAARAKLRSVIRSTLSTVWRRRAFLVTRLFLVILTALLLHGPIDAAQPPENPAATDVPRAQTPEALTATDVLRAVREGQASRHEKLDGQLRNDADGKVFAFQLVADGPLVRYQFQGTPPTVVQVHYNEDNSQLEESTGGSSEKLTPANFDKKILATDLSYEDLALRFVYWSRATITGEDSIKTRAAWKLLLNAPTHRTEYSSVNLWVDKDSGALLRADAYDWQGKLIKRFEVISGQKIEGRWYLKQMRIESLDPADAKVRSRTYMEIKGVAK